MSVGFFLSNGLSTTFFNFPQIIPNGSHPCYLDDPKLWNSLLLNFVSELKCRS